MIYDVTYDVIYDVIHDVFSVICDVFYHVFCGVCSYFDVYDMYILPQLNCVWSPIFAYSSACLCIWWHFSHWSHRPCHPRHWCLFWMSFAYPWISIYLWRIRALSLLNNIIRRKTKKIMYFDIYDIYAYCIFSAAFSVFSSLLDRRTPKLGSICRLSNFYVTDRQPVHQIMYHIIHITKHIIYIIYITRTP